MRIKIVQTPPCRVVDGVNLQHFVAGRKYDVGPTMGALLLAEGWAVPVPDDEPALVIPFSDSDQFPTRVANDASPPTVTGGTSPPYAKQISVAADIERRRRRRSSTN